MVGVGSAVLAHGPTLTEPKKTVLEDFVYLGYGAMILPGVRVGTFSIVGAGAVVTRDVPAGSVVAGNPARVLRKVTEAERTRIENNMRTDALFGQFLNVT